MNQHDLCHARLLDGETLPRPRRYDTAVHRSVSLYIDSTELARHPLIARPRVRAEGSVV